jgi:hypothetical protein
LQEKVANIQDFSHRFRKIASKMAGKEEIDKLSQAEDMIQEVAKVMLDQKNQLELSYVNDLIEALAKLQETKDELIDMGYESLQSPASTESAEIAPETTGLENKITPDEQGQNIEEQNIDYENVGAQSAGEVGSVTMPAPLANSFKNNMTKKANKQSLSKIFKKRLIKKWNKE